MKRLIIAALALAAFSTQAANIDNKAWDYNCVDANNGDKVVLHSSPDLLGGANFRLEVRPDFQAVIEQAAPVVVDGYSGFYHPETKKSSELTVIVLDNGKTLAVQYGPRVFTCGLDKEYNLVESLK